MGIWFKNFRLVVQVLWWQTLCPNIQGMWSKICLDNGWFLKISECSLNTFVNCCTAGLRCRCPMFHKQSKETRLKFFHATLSCILLQIKVNREISICALLIAFPVRLMSSYASLYAEIISNWFYISWPTDPATCRLPFRLDQINSFSRTVVTELSVFAIKTPHSASDAILSLFFSFTIRLGVHRPFTWEGIEPRSVRPMNYLKIQLLMWTKMTSKTSDVRHSITPISIISRKLKCANELYNN